MTRFTSLLAALVLVAGSVMPAKAGTLYGVVRGGAALVIVDTDTGALTEIGTFGRTVSRLENLAYDFNTKTMYGTSNKERLWNYPRLWTINTSTAKPTELGRSTGSGFGNAFDPNTNTFFMIGTNNSSSSLSTFDTTTRIHTLLKRFENRVISNLAFDPNTNRLFDADVKKVDGTTDLLSIDPAAINPNTGEGGVAVVGSLGQRMTALAFDPETKSLYGTTYGILWSIDRTTEKITNIGLTREGGRVEKVTGLEVVYEHLHNTEERLRQFAAVIDLLDVEIFTGKNNKAAAGRQNALANKFIAAADAVAEEDYETALDQLTSILKKLDGERSPPDWMEDSPEKDAIAEAVEALIVQLLL